MTTEEEEYYDSIDDSEFESCRSFCNAKFKEDDSDLEDNIKLEALVPFYTGNVEVNSIKNESKSNSSINLRGKLKRRNHKYLLPTLGKQKNRSYLTIFYARSGQQSKLGLPESSRATCMELAPKSCLSCDHDEKKSCCYFDGFDYSKNIYGKLRDDNYTNDGDVTITGKPRSISSSASDKKVYGDDTDTPLDRSEESNKGSSVKYNKNATRTKPLKVGELGGLGPNMAQEKLELLRRRQDYGKTASQKNRLKMMESKVVQKLKNEIRESNKF